MASDEAQIHLSIYDGARRPFTERKNLLLRVRTGATTEFLTRALDTKSFEFGEVTLDVKFFDNFGDNYTVLLTADDYRDAGFFPVRVSPNTPQEVSLMLVPKDPSFQFNSFDTIVANQPNIAKFLSLTPAAGSPKDNYDQSVEDHPTEAACLLNLATAMSQIFLANGTPLDYFRSIEWTTIAKDRFFGYATPDLVSEVKAAAARNLFAPELDPSFFHGDATSSFKEIRFGEANVQLTFHENDKRIIEGESCIRVEPDIDYYKDLAAHALLEVIYNQLTNSVTDPTQVYVLRWIAGKQAGLPEFDPPYRLVG